jgi:hypothetical protein
MMPGNVPNPTLIIHMTHVNNLHGIIANGGLIAKGALQAAGANYENIAYASIQEQRAAKPVPCGPGGSLHDYVPFYFAPRSPMLYTINRGNVACQGGQDSIVHLVTTAQLVVERGIGYAFTDGHGIMAYTEFFDDLADLGEIDWPLMRARYWHDTDDDGDRKRRRQAEFLVHRALPWAGISHIVVRSAARQTEVSGILKGRAHRPQVVVKSDWYY